MKLTKEIKDRINKWFDNKTKEEVSESIRATYQGRLYIDKRLFYIRKEVRNSIDTIRKNLKLR